jgi:RNA polymerase sigma factor (TIGR02999 family)
MPSHELSSTTSTTASGDLPLPGAPAAEDERRGADELLQLVYEQLRIIARQRMSAENVGHTLEATALVHEVYLRLAANRRLDWQNPAHFYAAAAEAMRRILVDHARSKHRQKRGGERQKLILNVLDLAVSQNHDEILALDAALCRLEEQNPEAAKIVQLRFYAGLSVDQTAEALALSPRTVDRRWKFARAWLYKALAQDD